MSQRRTTTLLSIFVIFILCVLDVTVRYRQRHGPAVAFFFAFQDLPMIIAWAAFATRKQDNYVSAWRAQLFIQVAMNVIRQLMSPFPKTWNYLVFGWQFWNGLDGYTLFLLSSATLWLPWTMLMIHWGVAKPLGSCDSKQDYALIGRESSSSDNKRIIRPVVALSLSIFLCLGCAFLGSIVCRRIEFAWTPSGGGPAMMGNWTGFAGTFFGFIGGLIIGSVVCQSLFNCTDAAHRKRFAAATLRNAIIGISIVLGLAAFKGLVSWATITNARITEKNRQIDSEKRTSERDQIIRAVRPEFMRLSQSIDRGAPIDISNELEFIRRIVKPTNNDQELGMMLGFLEPCKTSTDKVQLACLELFRVWLEQDRFVHERNKTGTSRADQVFLAMDARSTHYFMYFVDNSQFADDVRQSAFSIMLELQPFSHLYSKSDQQSMKQPVFVKPAAEFLTSDKSWHVPMLEEQEQYCCRLMLAFPETARQFAPALANKFDQIVPILEGKEYEISSCTDLLIEVLLAVGGPNSIDEKRLLARQTSYETTYRTKRRNEFVQRISETRTRLYPDNH